MALSKSEIENLLYKIRTQFNEFAVKYSPAWFNINSFDERYKHAVVNKLNLESFLISEISNFELLKARYELKKNKPGSFSEKADKIIQENLNKISKYNKIDFHHRSSAETKHMYGALSELYHIYFSTIQWSVSDPILRKKIILIENDFNKYFSSRPAKIPEKIEDFILALNRTRISNLELDKFNSNFLKESSFVIFGLISFCDSALASDYADLEKSVSAESFPVEESTKNKITILFQNCSIKEALKMVKQYSEGIILDFRLSFFKK